MQRGRRAVIYSQMRTCAQHGVAPLSYLTDALRQVARGWEESRLEELQPNPWLQLFSSVLNNSQSQKHRRTPTH
jgi:transposase IS66-like protein